MPNSYKQGSMRNSIWGKRELCQDSCAKLCNAQDVLNMVSPEINVIKIDQTESEDKDGFKIVEKSPIIDTNRPLIQKEKNLVQVPNSASKLESRRTSNDMMQFDATRAHLQSHKQKVEYSNSHSANSSHPEQPSRDLEDKSQFRVRDGGESIDRDISLRNPNSNWSSSQDEGEEEEEEQYEGGGQLTVEFQQRPTSVSSQRS